MRPHKAAIGHTWNIPGLSIRYCYDCGFHHQFPMPDQQEVEARYFKFEPYSQEWLEKEISEHRRGWWAAAYDYQYSLMGRPQSILDFGSGAGWFVNYINATYPNVKAYGVEPSRAAVEVAALNISRHFIFDQVFSYSLDKFMQSVPLPVDCVRASLVLEHVHDPYSTIEQLKQLVHPGGVMQFIVPSEFNPLQASIGNYWWVAKDHINYFSKQGFEHVMGRCGLQVIDITATFPTELWILAGFDHRQNYKVGEMTHRWRLQFEKLFPRLSFKTYRALFNRFGWGRELIVTVRK